MIIQPVFNLPTIITLVALMVIGATFAYIKVRENKSLAYAWIRRIFVLLLLGVLMVRPGIGAIEELEVYTSQYDIYFVVDTTNSMNAEDWDKDGGVRLDQVKEDIQKIVLNYSGARYSLITFDTMATIRTPLTHNSDALVSSVKSMNVEVSKYSKGSSITIANEFLGQVLSQNIEANPDRARIVFYFGDGEQTANEDPESFEALKPLINSGKVYGYGTEEGGIMKRNNGYIITTNQEE